MSRALNFRYQPDGDTLRAFLRDDTSFVKGIRGPVGSGKSVCSMVDLFLNAAREWNSVNHEAGETLQTPPEERTGPKKVRSVVVRNTSPQLETTTLKTWLEWFPEEVFGKMRWRPPFRHDIEIPELQLEWEVFFLALDREEDQKKLLSFEITSAFVNEAREVQHSLVTAVASRLRRYPRMMDGGARRSYMVMDTNAPDEEHWWSIMSGAVEPPDWMSAEDRMNLVMPDNWKFYTQPPALLRVRDSAGVLTGYELNPARENAAFTDSRYYADLRQGQTTDWIANMLMNEIGSIHAGRPVYRDFNPQVHVAPAPFGPDPSVRKIFVGLDWGLTPAACFGQDVRGQVRVFDEIVTRDTHTVQFAKIVARHIARHYPDFEIEFVGDPAEKRSEVDGRTPFQIFNAAGMKVARAWTNDPDIRMGAVQTQINTMVDGGRPGYLVSPSCTWNVGGKNGGYAYRKNTEEVDKKNPYSHIADAEQYMVLRMGYGRKLIRGSSGTPATVQASYKQGLFSRHRGTARQQNRASVFARRMREGE